MRNLGGLGRPTPGPSEEGILYFGADSGTSPLGSSSFPIKELNTSMRTMQFRGHEQNPYDL